MRANRYKEHVSLTFYTKENPILHIDTNAPSASKFAREFVEAQAWMQGVILK